VLTVRLEPTIQGAFRDWLVVCTVRPLNRVARALAQRRASLRLIEAGIDQGRDLLEAPGGDLVRVLRCKPSDATRCRISGTEGRVENALLSRSVPSAALGDWKRNGGIDVGGLG